MLKKIIASTLAIAMFFTMLIGTSIFANDTDNELHPVSADTIVQESLSESVDLSEFDFVIDLPQKPIETIANSEEPKAEGLDPDFVESLDLATIKTQPLPKNNGRSMGYNLFEFEGTIAAQGDIYAVGPITLQQNQICQAKMFGPYNKTLEYDLYLYELDTATGNLISPAVDASTYTGTSVAEAVGVVNKEVTAKTYYVIAVSRMGASATDKFTLYVSLDYEFDQYETNENAFTATPVPTITHGIQRKVEDSTINSRIDDDWYAIYVDDAAITSLNFTINENSSSKVSLEMYSVSNGTVMNKSASAKIKDGIQCRISGKGYYYLRISSNSNAVFDAPTYDLYINSLKEATKAAFKVTVGGEPIKTSASWNDGQRRYVIKYAEIMEFRVTYLTADDKPALDTSDRVHISIRNDRWNVGTQNNLKENSASAFNGVAVVSVKIGSPYNPLYEPVTVKIWSDAFGYCYNGEMMLVTRYEL